LDIGGASAGAGRFALAAGLATIVSVLLVGSYRLRQVREPMYYSAIIATLHVATFVGIFLIDLVIRLINGSDAPALFDGTVAERIGPASAIVAIMSVAAIAGSLLAIGATAT